MAAGWSCKSCCWPRESNVLYTLTERGLSNQRSNTCAAWLQEQKMSMGTAQQLPSQVEWSKKLQELVTVADNIHGSRKKHPWKQAVPRDLNILLSL